MNRFSIYTGSYSESAEQGIKQYDLEVNKLQAIGGISGIENPSFLIANPQKSVLYAVSEISQYDGLASGAVAAYRIAPDTGQLSLLNMQATRGGSPCHMTLDSTKRYLIVANYSGASIAIYRLLQDGSIGDQSDLVIHKGRGIREDRQSQPHPHAVKFDPEGEYLYVPDLGLDRVFTYRLDQETGKLQHCSSVKLPDGTGPRHLVFHSSLNVVYSANELNSTVTLLERDVHSGALRELANWSTLPPDYEGINHCADIHLTPSGRTLFVSNRGHDSLAMYEVDPSSGNLTFVNFIPTQGQTPRNFAILPSGDELIIANQDSSNLIRYHFDEQNRSFQQLGEATYSEKPVCVLPVAME